MCEPATLLAAHLAITAASVAAQYQAQQEAADRQSAANTEQARQIKESQAQASMDAARQRTQATEQASAEANQYAMEHYKAMASMDAIVGEGASGVSAQRNFASMGVKTGQDFATLASNSNKTQSEISLGESAALKSGNNQLASIRAPERPSLLGAALQIGGATINYKTGMHKLDGLTPKATSKDT